MIETTLLPAPVQKVLTVNADVEHAFTVFTQRIGRWWPRTHSTNRAPQVDVVLEPRAGGRWYELGEDGSECEWGKVLIWQPPTRLVLAWQLGTDFKYDATLVTEVEVNFTAINRETTLVRLEHRSLERFGRAANTLRERLDSPSGWGAVLAAFCVVTQ